MTVTLPLRKKWGAAIHAMLEVPIVPPPLPTCRAAASASDTPANSYTCRSPSGVLNTRALFVQKGCSIVPAAVSETPAESSFCSRAPQPDPESLETGLDVVEESPESDRLVALALDCAQPVLSIARSSGIVNIFMLDLHEFRSDNHAAMLRLQVLQQNRGFPFKKNSSWRTSDGIVSGSTFVHSKPRTLDRYGSGPSKLA